MFHVKHFFIVEKEEDLSKICILYKVTKAPSGYII